MGTRPLIVAARYKILLIVPFLVIVPIAVAFSLLNQKTQYVSASTLWAEQSGLISTVNTGDNPYLSPAQNRANDLNELLNTESFRKQAAVKMGLPVDTPGQIAEASYIVRTGTVAFADGQHLVDVRNTGKDPALAQQIVQAIVAAFKEQYTNNTLRNAANAKTIAESRLTDVQAQLATAQTALTSYISQQPATANLPLQPRYVELDGAVKQAQTQVESTQNQIAQIEALSAGTAGVLDVTLRTYDEPNLPLAPQQVSKKTLIAIPFAGLLMALSLSAGLYAFLLKTDNSIRVAEDLKALPGLLLLGTVPDVSSIKRRRWPKNFFRVAVTALGLHPQP